MSQAIFPTLPGLAWNVKKTPLFNTRVQQAASGRELRLGFYSYPIWKYSLAYNVLRADTVNQELQQLMGFFLARQGQYDSFLFSDPDDNAVSGQNFGSGDGSTQTFQLVRAYGGYTEPVFDLNGSPSIYKQDWQGNQLQSSSARTNQLTQSDAFDNAAWVKSALSVTANAATAPDGTNTAEKLIADTTTAVHQMYESVSDTGTVTFSIYAKAGEYKYLCLSATGSAFNYAYFDLNAGTVALSDSTVNGKITSLGSGWYRCSITYNKTSSSAGYPLAYPFGGTLPAAATTGPNFTGDGTSGIYVFGAQHETGSSATPYIPTTTAAVTVTDYTLSATALVTFANAPASGATLTWSGSFYRRCRFLADTAEFSKFAYQLWELQQLEFQSVKL